MLGQSSKGRAGAEQASEAAFYPQETWKVIGLRAGQKAQLHTSRLSLNHGHLLSPEHSTSICCTKHHLLHRPESTEPWSHSLRKTGLQNFRHHAPRLGLVVWVIKFEILSCHLRPLYNQENKEQIKRPWKERKEKGAPPWQGWAFPTPSA